MRSAAVLMRSGGASLNQICRDLSLSKSTVWGWIKDIHLTDEQLKSLEKSEARKRAQELGTQAMVKKYKALEEDAFERGRRRIVDLEAVPSSLLAGILLYWAEGNKGGHLKFSNSDARMVKIFVKFLIEFMDVRREDIKVQLCFYDNVKTQSEIEDYWSQVTGIEKSRFYRSQVNKHPQVGAGKKIGKLPYGVCSVQVISKYKNYEMRGMIGAVVDKLGV